MFDSNTKSNLLVVVSAEMKKKKKKKTHEKKNTGVSNLIECHCHLMLCALNLGKWAGRPTVLCPKIVKKLGS